MSARVHLSWCCPWRARSYALLGMETEGIFRLVGKHSDVDQIRRNIDAHMQVNLSNVTMHSVAEVLKLYLRELPYPIIPRSQFFDRFKAASSTPSRRLRELCPGVDD